MPSPYVTPTPQNTPYEYVGDIPGLGSLQLTKLARSFEELYKSDLSDLFPNQTNPERTIVIETMQQGLSQILPIVKPGVPSGAFMPPERIFRRVVEPALFRMDEFIDQYLINQLRKPGTLNDLYPATEIIQRRVQKMVAWHNTTVDYFRVQVLLGGIDYTDPRTNVSINVSTLIPPHNLFRYDGYNAVVAAGAPLGFGGYVAASNFTNNKGRPEALMFGDTSGRAGIPWTDPDADIIRCLRLIKQYLKNTNKNVYTDIFMSHDLYTVLQENALIKAYAGTVGIITHDASATTNIANRSLEYITSTNTPAYISYGPGGDITQLAGLTIRLIDHTYTNPLTGEVTPMWPSNKVVIVARSHVNDRGATLGYTQHCVGEAPDGQPGMWMVTSQDHTPPLLPGRSMQLGNSFLPYATYPQWIAILDVCEPEDIDSKLILRADLSYGTF